MLRWLREFMCGLNGGHDEIYDVQEDNLAVKCMNCQRRTPGISTTKEKT